jgi:hypothetical protein
MGSAWMGRGCLMESANGHRLHRVCPRAQCVRVLCRQGVSWIDGVVCGAAQISFANTDRICLRTNRHWHTTNCIYATPDAMCQRSAFAHRDTICPRERRPPNHHTHVCAALFVHPPAHPPTPLSRIIQDENRHNLPATCERALQSQVVLQAQVLSEPEEGW